MTIASLPHGSTHLRDGVLGRLWSTVPVKVFHCATFRYIIDPEPCVHLAFVQVQKPTITILHIIFP